ncbi:MAG: Rieske 2Fe-2S domain-containing protein [Polyangiaceae bacterium]
MKVVGRIPEKSLAVGALARLSVPPYDVVIARTEHGVFALDNACNHAGASMADGWIQGACLICPVHQYAFELATGALVRPKGLCAPQRTFTVRREGDDLVVYDPFQLKLVGV